MCGIVGEYNFLSKPNEDWLVNSLKNIEHRGPDNSGYRIIDNLSIGHRRLSILDLSDKGNQPFENSHSIFAYNGETYNYKDLSKKLDNEILNSQTDTEVIHRLLDISLTNVSDLRGMFAFGYYEKSSKSLYLARDHFGIKPLYYHCNEDRLVFSSEIGPLVNREDYDIEVNNEALEEHLLLGYAVKDKTLFSGIKRILPGEILKVSCDGLTVQQFHSVITDGQSSGCKDLATVLDDSVKAHSMADVRIGLMLSGGFDSNLLLSAIKKDSLEHKLTAFNAGSDNSEDKTLYLEREIAKDIAELFDVDFQKIGIRGFSDNHIKKVFDISEEPVCNPSSLLVDIITSQANKSGVKVLFSGHGGDELFGGYRRHLAAHNLDKLKYLKYLAPSWLTRILNSFPNIQRVLAALKSNNMEPLFLNLIGLNFVKRNILKFKTLDSSIERINQQFDISNTNESILSRTLICEYPNYLASQNLINMDKISMANSVEVRVPFIDIDMFEHANSISSKKLIGGYSGKLPLRKLAGARLPESIFGLKKSGFSPDLEAIVSSKYAKQLLADEKSRARSFYDHRAVGKLLRSSRRTASDNMMLYNLMVLEHWFRKYID